MFGFLSTNFAAVVNYRSLLKYPCPKNMKFFWNFGVLSLLFLVVQLLSGLFLTLFYDPNIAHAFDSVEHIVRNVNYGWVIRSIHSNGASFFFFLFIYIFYVDYIIEHLDSHVRVFGLLV
jgi:quinol-cytochrome oxidoreductase complex cytochrome b subunit